MTAAPLQDQRTAFELVDDDHPELRDMRPDGHVPAQVVKLMQQRAAVAAP